MDLRLFPDGLHCKITFFSCELCFLSQSFRIRAVLGRKRWVSITQIGKSSLGPSNKIRCPDLICRRRWLNPMSWYTAACQFHQNQQLLAKLTKKRNKILFLLSKEIIKDNPCCTLSSF